MKNKILKTILTFSSALMLSAILLQSNAQTGMPALPDIGDTPQARCWVQVEQREGYTVSIVDNEACNCFAVSGYKGVRMGRVNCTNY